MEKKPQKATLIDSELLALMVIKEFMNFWPEREFVGYIYVNHSDVFPDMVD